MALLDIIASLLRRGEGFWGHMNERVRSRTAIALERERNSATANVIPMLKPGVDFMETEEGGRTRIIRIAPLPHESSPNGSDATAASPSLTPVGSRTSPPALGPSPGPGSVALPGQQPQGRRLVGEQPR
ncbi:hypothetical protein ACODT3_43940 [Streptomyces sp. 4.24]|uniref:hypothetical protein n=1 Tax=Streptomyces tritrimontium TaxID=3406573 RepID=UPI003BB55330